MQLFKRNRVTESELGEAKLVATTNISGNFNQTDISRNPIIKTIIPFTQDIANGNVDTIRQTTPFLWNLIQYFQDYYSYKIKYSGVENFDGKYLSNRLYWQGAVMVFKVVDKYYSLPFTISEYDELMFPLKITPIWPNKKIADKTYTVGKDCVISYANYNSFLQASLWTFGKLYQLWGLFLELTDINKEIGINLLFNRERLMVPTNGSQDESYLAVEQMLYDGRLVIPIDAQSYESISLKGGIEGSKGIKVSFEDRSASLWGNFNNKWSQIKELAYLGHNGATEKKERLIMDEVGANNAGVEAGINNYFEYQEKFAEEFNKVFSENLKVEFCDTEKEEEEEEDTEENKEGVDNE